MLVLLLFFNSYFCSVFIQLSHPSSYDLFFSHNLFKIFLSRSITKVSTIAITLSLFLQTSTTFPDISSFTKIQTPPVLASFPEHHSLYLLSKVPTKRAPWSFHLTSCVQHISTLLFLSSSHTSVFLPQRLATVKVPSLIPWYLGLNPEILRTPAHLRASGD